MSLFDDLKRVCSALVDAGWQGFLNTVSDLDLNSKDLSKELFRKLDITRYVPELRDFANEGVRAIEPGIPSHSFLFHVLASPSVVTGLVKRYPTPEELEIVENYIYGVHPPSIEDLRNRCNDAPLALVVFACEYRAGAETVHQRHADMCYSRTGVARVGTDKASYNGQLRGYSSVGSPYSSRVIPSRFCAYVAARMKGDFANFGPLRPRKPIPDDARVPSDLNPDPKAVNTGGNPVLSDDQRFFWVPLHKVFPGTECIRGNDMDLNLEFRTHHHNEKIRRLHMYLASNQLPSQYSGDTLKKFPFLIGEDRLAKIENSKGGSAWVFPIPHELAEEAYMNGQRIGFEVPPGGAVSGAAFRVPSRPGGGRPAPEYVYVRQKIEKSGNLKNLNAIPELVQVVNKGHYEAQLYVDYSGDGWIAAGCEKLALAIPRSLAAYSMLAAPDPLPLVSEQDVYDWWTQSAPPDVRKTLFPSFIGPIPPEPLSDARITANITFRKKINEVKSVPVFDSNDDSYTAIVSGLGAGQDQQRPQDSVPPDRVSFLPDDASGLFAPGWEVSRDQNDDENQAKGVLHLAAYGASIPFLEDERLCAAQSAFWPAVAPDTTRLYQPGKYYSVTPIPDRLLGFDELTAPEIIKLPSSSPGVIRLYSLSHTDYINRASKTQGFNFKKLAHVSAHSYELWTLLMARVYVAIGADATQDKSTWSVVSFDKFSDIKDKVKDELTEAQKATTRRLVDPYYFFLVQSSGSTQDKKKPEFVLINFERFVVAFATPDFILYYDSDFGKWEHRAF